MRERIRVVLFIVILTTFFGLLVSGLHVVLKERIELNREAAEQRVVLELLTLPATGDAAAVSERFHARVTSETRTAPDGVKVRVYRPQEASSTRVVFSLSGMGFWDRIDGLMAVDTTTGKIAGLAFTEQKETPGLGAMIDKREWREKFIGKAYRTAAGPAKIKIVPTGSARADQPEIDAITGATETSRAVEKILNHAIARFVAVTAKEPTP